MKSSTALVFYLIVGVGGLLATLATPLEPWMPAERKTVLREVA